MDGQWITIYEFLMTLLLMDKHSIHQFNLLSIIDGLNEFMDM